METSTLNTAGASLRATRTNGSGHTSDISLPNQHEIITDIGIDIGGSLAKVVYFSKNHDGAGCQISFMKFQTKEIDKCIEFIRSLWGENEPTVPVIKATGGGAVKYYDLFKKELNVKMMVTDEMDSLICGFNFFVKSIEYEIFTYDERVIHSMRYTKKPEIEFPYLLVNIGSGVSILKVNSADSYQRISGTSIGGGTVWGLLSLLTNVMDYDGILELSKSGDNRNVDILVGDIYGGDYQKIGLKETAIASSLGKISKYDVKDRDGKFNNSDVCRSVLYLVSNTIGQLAYLNAKAHDIDRIYFSGFFIRGHRVTMNTLSYAISYWSNGKMSAHFLRHEGYIGAMGALLLHEPPIITKGFTEIFSKPKKLSGGFTAALGKLREVNADLVPFPLVLRPDIYVTDTVELMDDESLGILIDYFEKDLDKYFNSKFGRRIEKVDSYWRSANEFSALFREHLDILKKEPGAYGELTARSILELRGYCLQQFGLDLIIKMETEAEYKVAFKLLPTLMEHLESLDCYQRAQCLTRLVIKGNTWDWRDCPMTEISKKSRDEFYSLWSAPPQNIQSITPFVKKLASSFSGTGYKRVIIFVDNYGMSLVLGIVPLCNYLLLGNVSIVLAASSSPSLGDITTDSLNKLLNELSESNQLIKNALSTRKLVTVQTGTESPCLNFSKVCKELEEVSLGADLIIVEGTARSIYTNMNTKFKVDTLKVGVVRPLELKKKVDTSSEHGVRCVFEEGGGL